MSCDVLLNLVMWSQIFWCASKTYDVFPNGVMCSPSCDVCSNLWCVLQLVMCAPTCNVCSQVPSLIDWTEWHRRTRETMGVFPSNQANISIQWCGRTDPVPSTEYNVNHDRDIWMVRRTTHTPVNKLQLPSISVWGSHQLQVTTSSNWKTK